VIIMFRDGGHALRGELVAWDSYSLVLHIGGADSLINKSPGMEIRADEDGGTTNDEG